MVMMAIPAHLMVRLADGLAVGQAARFLPISSGFGFELGLDGGWARGVDISVRIEREDGSHRLLRGAPPLAAAICRAWEGAGDDLAGRLAPAIDTVWLEYDAPEADRPWTPSLAFCRLTPAFNRLGTGKALAVVARLHDLAGYDWDAAAERRFLALRAAGPLRHIGFPIGRKSRAVRLCFSIGMGDPAAALDRAGLRGRGPDSLRVLQGLAPDGCETVLHLDIAGADIGPRTGLEVMPIRPGAWKPLLDGLVACGLCRADQAALIRGWPGAPAGLWNPLAPLSRRLPDPGRWPACWEKAVIVRRASHVKLVSEPGEALTVKAYLFAGLLWNHWRVRGAA
ncbi:hypothetical protein [Nitrospirillum sp. BR 11163]|uniref:hypothetical protein n=1 Tax=Nitrospirillum sp. BR 11163 TaxID=3104323 RepID=UPI002AFE3055|nr:hypothetical protein [Nitrospirillum sp. BR 11163]MEA1672862.1 hypothetical protein [Nitrospirillum sp. BR 11163]